MGPLVFVILMLLIVALIGTLSVLSIVQWGDIARYYLGRSLEVMGAMFYGIIIGLGVVALVTWLMTW